MDLDDLRFFLIAAEELSFRRASRRSHISQSTLSRKMRALEDYYGIRAFIRNPTKLELTREGKALVQIASDLLEQESKQFKRLANIKEKGPATISLGAGPSIDTELLLYLLDRFQSLHSAVNITLRCGGARDLIKNVQQKEMDLLLTCALPDYFLLDGLESYTLCRSPLTCIAPAGASVNRQNTMDLFSNNNFIQYRAGYQVRVLTDSYIRYHNLKITSNFSVGEASGINALVSLGKGFSITPYVSAYIALSRNRVKQISLNKLDSYTVTFNAYYRKQAEINSNVQILANYLHNRLHEICDTYPGDSNT